jgi:hypothetical protein
MRSHEITQLLDLPTNGFHTAVVGLTPRDAGVNAVEKSALTPWKSGVNPVENSGLTPRFECAEKFVLNARKWLISGEMFKAFADLIADLIAVS